MLSPEQYNELLPTRELLRHIYDGGSSQRTPIKLYLQIWNALGKFPVDLNCNACKISMAKELFVEMEIFETAKQKV